MKSEFERQLPETSSILENLIVSIGTVTQDDVFSTIWPTVPKDSIDYAIMENAEEICVVPINIGWNDVGSWLSVLNSSEADDFGNVLLSGEHHAIETSNTLVYSKKFVTTIGVENLIVIDTPDVLLICDSARSENVKKVVESLNESKKVLL